MEPRPDPSTLNLGDSADVRHTDVEVEGVRFHVAEAGPEDGHPVVLVHGWPQHWWCWRKVAPLLGEYRCVMPDLRGHGWSDAPADGYEKRRLAEDVMGIMDSLGLEAAPEGTFSSEEEEIYLERISRREGARATVALYRSFLLRELPRNQIGRAMADPFSTTTRLLMGERDPIAMGADLEGYEPHAPHMILEWVPEAGHFLPEEEPELVASHVRELVASQGT